MSAWLRWSGILLFAAVCLHGAPASAELGVDAEEELRLLEIGADVPKHFPYAKHRVAVFTYEDPDGTGLGDSLAALAGRAILTGSRVSSLGVIQYKGDLSVRKAGEPAYFDKVDRLLQNQEVPLAVWGRVGVARERIVVETFAQLPAEVVAARFTWRRRLPQAMGGGELRARLRPNRFLVQRLEIGRDAAGTIVAAARRLGELRAEPRDNATVVARIPLGEVYVLKDRRADWVLLELVGGARGWSRPPQCQNECGRFLQTAAFAGGLLGYMDEGGAPPDLPDVADEAKAVRDLLRTFDGLFDDEGLEQSLAIAKRWTAHPATAQPTSAARKPIPGGAAFANARALAEISILLREASPSSRLSEEEYDQIAVEPERVRVIASRLARAALLDPRNAELLHNLAVLFRYAGDEPRARKARSLAERVGR